MLVQEFKEYVRKVNEFPNKHTLFLRMSEYFPKTLFPRNGTGVSADQKSISRSI